MAVGGSQLLLTAASKDLTHTRTTDARRTVPFIHLSIFNNLMLCIRLRKTVDRAYSWGNLFFCYRASMASSAGIGNAELGICIDVTDAAV